MFIDVNNPLWTQNADLDTRPCPHAASTQQQLIHRLTVCHKADLCDIHLIWGEKITLSI